MPYIFQISPDDNALRVWSQKIDNNGGLHHHFLLSKEKLLLWSPTPIHLNLKNFLLLSLMIKLQANKRKLHLHFLTKKNGLQEITHFLFLILWDICVCVQTYTYMQTNTHIHINIHTRVYIYVCVCACARAHIYRINKLLKNHFLTIAQERMNNFADKRGGWKGNLKLVTSFFSSFNCTDKYRC